MTCLSDIDLATLHKSRLEERLNYKLAWGAATTNRLTAAYHPHHQLQQYQHHQQALHQHSYQKQQQQQQAQKSTAYSRNATAQNKQQKSKQQQQKQVDKDNKHQQQQTSAINNSVGTSTNTVSHSRLQRQSHDGGDGKFATDDLLNGNRIELSNKMQHLNLNFDDDALSGHQKVQHKSRKTCAEEGRRRLLEDDPNCNYFTATTRRQRSGSWPRTRSLNAPSPFQQFGPCGRIMKNQAVVMQIQDPASQRLTWYKPPLTVLVIKKVRDTTVLAPFVQLVEWLVQEKHMVVWVESAVLDDPLLVEDKKFKNIKEKLVTFKDGRDDLTDRIDFIVCLGGDGTLLYASLLFQHSVPPVMAFHLGSLGFLTPFEFENFQEQVTNVLEGHAALTLRSRLRCIIYRKSDRSRETESDYQAKNSYNYQTDGGHYSTKGGDGTSKKGETNILVLNEVVIDRGPSPYLSNIDLFLDGKYITSVQGDGLIVSTPTGSTAYAVAAGASMIHPSVPAIMVTPICPHSLSFRPIVVPAGVELRISISPDSRNTSWVSFDGRNRQELLHGDCLRVTTSIYPVPSICAQDQITDWFDSLAECLHWNVRKKQKCLDELCDLTASGSEDTLDDLDRVNDSILDS